MLTTVLDRSLKQRPFGLVARWDRNRSSRGPCCHPGEESNRRIRLGEQKNFPALLLSPGSSYPVGILRARL